MKQQRKLTFTYIKLKEMWYLNVFLRYNVAFSTKKMTEVVSSQNQIEVLLSESGWEFGVEVMSYSTSDDKDRVLEVLKSVDSAEFVSGVSSENINSIHLICGPLERSVWGIVFVMDDGTMKGFKMDYREIHQRNSNLPVDRFIPSDSITGFASIGGTSKFTYTYIPPENYLYETYYRILTELSIHLSIQD